MVFLIPIVNRSTHLLILILIVTDCLCHEASEITGIPKKLYLGLRLNFGAMHLPVAKMVVFLDSRETIRYLKCWP